MSLFVNTLLWFSRAGALGGHFMRIAIAVVFLWIGGAKFAAYEADSTTPFIANNPVIGLFDEQPEAYRAHLTRGGEFVPAQRRSQSDNGPYTVFNGPGVLEVTIGVLVLAGIASPVLGAVGALLAFLTSCVTLSFLVTTPEVWISALSDAAHRFPSLYGAGRPVPNDVVLWARGFVLLVDSAGRVLPEHPRLAGVRPATAAAVARPSFNQ